MLIMETSNWEKQKDSTNVFTLVEEMKKLDHKPCNSAKTALAGIIYPAKSITKRSIHIIIIISKALISREHIESAGN